MKGMRLLPVILVLLLIGGVCATNLRDVFPSHPDIRDEKYVNGDVDSCIIEFDDDDSDNSHVEDDDISVPSFTPVAIPTFVNRLLDNADWWADTICVVNGTAYYWAYEEYGRCNVIFNKDRVLLAAPVLCIDSFALDCDYKFYVSNVGKSVLVDFSDKKTLERLKCFSKVLPSFTRYRKDSIAGFGRNVFYSFTVDFPKASLPNSSRIGNWLVKLVERSQSHFEDVPDVSALYIGYSRRLYDDWKYQGNINDKEEVAKFATNLYFAIKKGEYGTNEEDYPPALFSVLNLQAIACNKRFVTYQEYTHDYNGGAHGFYTERLVSYDHIQQKEVDYSYLFKPGCIDDVLAILLDEAKKTPQYKEWEPNIKDYVTKKYKDGKETEVIALPNPGLFEDGVVFSFQPYSISCFAAGPFHFTIPYSRIQHCMTERGKWCAGL